MEKSGSPNDQAGGAKLVLISLGLAFAAAVLVALYVERIRNRTDEEGFYVYRLNVSVEAGDAIQAKDVDTVKVPAQYRDAFRGVVEEGSLSGYLGQTPIEMDAQAGQFVMWAWYAGGPEGAGNQPPEGKVAVPLRINPRIQPGLLRPGMKVNIVGHFQTGGSIPEAMLVMEDVRLEAVGRYTGGDAPSRGMGNYRTITIFVDTDTAKRLSMVQELAVRDFELHVRRQHDSTAPQLPPNQINPVLVRMLKDRLAQPYTGEDGPTDDS